MDEEDPLQWLWDGIKYFQIKVNDLTTRAMLDFRRPFDATRHDSNCELKLNNAALAKSCICCMGALTFDEAKHVQGKLQSDWCLSRTASKR